MNIDEKTLARLKAAARDAADRSYSPYSRFPVGAALLAEDGTVHQGCNVENASFGLTQCAERSALAAAVANGVPPGTPLVMVVYAPGRSAHPPCGACRQVLKELMSREARVISVCDGEEVSDWSADELLPDAFTPTSILGSRKEET
jgi:cytidine deaminase